MNRLSTLTTTVFVAVATLLSVTCSHAVDLPAKAGAGRTVRAGIFNFKPLVIFDQNRPPTGFIVDILNHIAQKEKWSVEYVPGTWLESLERLKTDQIDIILCIGYSAERDAFLDFPTEHVLLDWGLVYRKKGSGIQTIMDMEGKTIAAMKASIYTAGFRNTLEQFNIKATIVEKTEVKDVFGALESGAVDAAISSTIAGLSFESSATIDRSPVVFTPVKLGYAVNAGKNADLLTAIDKKLLELKSDRNSFYFKKLDEWITGRRTTVPREFYWVLGGISSAFFVVIAFVVLLRRQVRTRTNDLQTEIDQRKLAEEALLQKAEALRKSGRLLAEVERIGKVGGWELDIDSGKQLWTEETRRIHEVDSSFEPTVESGIGFYAPASRSLIEDAVRRAIEQGELFDVELEVVTAKGNHRNVHAVGRADLAQRRVFGLFQDITERVRLAEEKALLEDQLRQAQKVEAIGRLAGGVAHDFNNITAIILGYGELLQGRLGPEDPSYKYVEQIVEAGRRSAGLTRQLLAFSRKQTLQPEVLDLNGLLRDYEKMLGRLIGEDVELEFKLAAELPRVVADPGQLEQVVTNLAINARDAMPRGGRLTIETADVELDAMYAAGHQSVVPGRYVMLALTDNGCGMDKATMSRLFEPFFTTKEKGKGTGLGLATVYGIVKQSGGHIWAYSQPGQGTCFKIYLPQTDAPAEARLDARAGEAVPRGGGESILLVEDEEALRELCETVLSRLGYRVNAAENGSAALRLVQEQGLEPDLVLTDVIMPVMGGAELVERLRRDRPGCKVLYMSGYPDEAIAPHGVLGPGIPFIQKPFSERVLALKICEVLGGPAVSAPSELGVLMIDDDEQYRELVRHFCAKRGHRCTGVDSAAAALDELGRHAFAVLLVDLNIPGTSGEAVLREIRAAGHAAPAIVLTGDVAAADMDLLGPLGVVLALEKSSNAGPLLQAIEAASPAIPGGPPAACRGSE